MPRGRALENEPQPVPGRGAGSAPPRPTPLTLVAGAVAGGDLQSVAATAADAIGCPVAIAIPGIGTPVVAPPGSLGDEAMTAIAAHAAAVSAGREPAAGSAVAAAVPVRIGELTVGIVAAAGPSAAGTSAPERRAWLEAAAAAASVTAVMRDSQDGEDDASDAVLLAELAAGPPVDLPDFLVRARRLGCDLTAGGVALSARAPAGAGAGGGGGAGQPENGAGRMVRAGATPPGTLIAELRPGALLAVIPVVNGNPSDPGAALAAELREAGLSVAASTPRRDPALLHEAVREAELVAELGTAGADGPAGQDDTFRLLIGVLLHDRNELEQLHRRTLTPLAAYDARHDTDLIATLRAFLAHDGSTTETAETMKLHRHTVGYRLARVHEVSGLSPYESDGRERLSLGLKAHQILAAARRLEAPRRQ
jgi:PucR-like helix-turn-helix protein/diguanylate cyclase with GGDEF domain